MIVSINQMLFLGRAEKCWYKTNKSSCANENVNRYEGRGRKVKIVVKKSKMYF